MKMKWSCVLDVKKMMKWLIWTCHYIFLPIRKTVKGLLNRNHGLLGFGMMMMMEKFAVGFQCVLLVEDECFQDLFLSEFLEDK